MTTNPANIELVEDDEIRRNYYENIYQFQAEASESVPPEEDVIKQDTMY